MEKNQDEGIHSSRTTALAEKAAVTSGVEIVAADVEEGTHVGARFLAEDSVPLSAASIENGKPPRAAEPNEGGFTRLKGDMEPRFLPKRPVRLDFGLRPAGAEFAPLVEKENPFGVLGALPNACDVGAPILLTVEDGRPDETFKLKLGLYFFDGVSH